MYESDKRLAQSMAAVSKNPASDKVDKAIKLAAFIVAHDAVELITPKDQVMSWALKQQTCKPIPVPGMPSLAYLDFEYDDDDMDTL